ncbi:MAG TPA: potassium-transporting ATPase subunit KdpC [Clostridia bacterium]|nr:potassium-transporting ATPase subunit KdpC [Clostridia bacterium]
MWQQIIPGLRIKLFMTLLVGIVYPLAITGICQVVFPHQANGSLVRAGGRVVGSELIGQNFTRPEYFQPRPSAAGADGYDATASSGSNYGPTNKKLIERVKASVERFRKDNPGFIGPIPADLLMTSASGLDPHISPDSALAQAPRVSNARNLNANQVKHLIVEYTEGPDLGLLGEARVNVLRLNLALDREFPTK